MNSTVLEESITFMSGLTRLAAVLAYPEHSMPRQAVLLCSPHPHFAGDMGNNVICAIARRLARTCLVIRFDYRGVGDSGIDIEPTMSTFDYWAEIEQAQNYSDAVEDVHAAAETLFDVAESRDIELSVVGYSFGAATGMLFARQAQTVSKIVCIAPPLGRISFDFMAGCDRPSLHLIGKKDFLYSEEQVHAYRRTLGTAAKVVVLEHADHFFRGDEDVPAGEVEAFVTGCNRDQQENPSEY